MKKLFHYAVIASMILVGCSESNDIAEDVSFSVSAYLIDVLVEPPKVNDELQYKIVVDKLPDGEYKAVYNSDGKDSHITIGTRTGQTYNQGTNFDISFTNSTAYLNYTGKNAGTHNIQFKVMNEEYSAVANIEQVFVSEVYCYFDEFSKTEFPFGYTPTAQFLLQNVEDESNEFYAEYVIISGEEYNPRLSFPNLSVTEWMPGQKRRIGTGTLNQIFEIEYSQGSIGEVQFKVRVSDKYGWEKENLYTLRVGQPYRLVPMLNNGHFTEIARGIGGNRGQYLNVYLRLPNHGNAIAEEDIYFCVWGDNVIYNPLITNSSQTLAGKWIVGCIEKGRQTAGAIYIIERGSLPEDFVIDDSKTQLRNIVLHPSMDDLSWKYTIDSEYHFFWATHVGDGQGHSINLKYSEPDKKYN